MNVLQKIVSSLSKEESRFYKLFGARTNKHSNRKDFELFDYLRKQGDKHNEDWIAKKLYGSNKNAYYQLKSRLVTDLNKSLSLQYLDKEADYAIYQQLLLSRVFLRKGEASIAHWYLAKAEQQAQKAEHYELLNSIYGDFLKLSHDMVSIDVEEYLEKQRNNKKKLDKAQEFDQAIALVMYRIKTAQNFSQQNKGVLSILEEVLSKQHEGELLQSPKFRMKTYQVVSRILLQKHDYLGLEDYLKHTYQEFVTDSLFNKSNHEQKLMMLSYLCNCLYKTNKHQESLEYAQLLYEALHEHHNMLKDKFIFYYYNALVINYSKIDKQKELEILAEAKDIPAIKQLPTYTLFIYLNTALAHFDLANYKMASKNFSQLLLQEDFSDIAESLQLKIIIADIIVKYELGDFDLVEEKIKKLRKSHQKLLKTHPRDHHLLAIIKELMYCNNIAQNKNIQATMQSFISLASDAEADEQDIINYNLWLKDKKKRS
jgi:hypothetical protein